MRDLFGVMWTRCAGAPRKIADFVLTEREFRMTFDRNAEDLPGPSCLLPASRFRHGTFVHKADELLHVPAFVWSKIPPEIDAAGNRNVLRRMYLRAAQAAGRDPAPGIESDYEVLMMSGRDGIGHVDYFRSDLEAERFYETARMAKLKKVTLGRDGDLWESFAIAIADKAGIDDDRALSLIAARVGPSPSVNGMIPKLAVSVPDAPTWDGSATHSGRGRVGGQAFVDAIVKAEPQGYDGLVELEALCLDVHRRAGLRVPRSWTHRTAEGTRLLAIERFDRDAGRPVPMESMFSVLSVGGGRAQAATSVRLPTESSYERVGKALAVASPVISTTPDADRRELVQRLLLASLTGNGDMHLENIAVLGTNADRRLSPVFDPAPMRAFPRHNLVAALRMCEDGQPFKLGVPSDFGEQLERLAATCGVDGDEFREMGREALVITEGYLDEAASLDVPAHTVQNLRVAVEAVRYRVERQIDGPSLPKP